MSAMNDEAMIKIWADDKEAQSAFKRVKAEAETTRAVFQVMNQGVAGGVQVFRNVAQSVSTAGGELGGFAGRAGDVIGRVGSMSGVVMMAIPAWNGLTVGVKSAHAALLSFGASNPAGWLMLAAGAAAALAVAFVSMGDSAQSEADRIKQIAEQIEAELTRLCTPRQIRLTIKYDGAEAARDRVENDLRSVQEEKASLEDMKSRLYDGYSLPDSGFSNERRLQEATLSDSASGVLYETKTLLGSRGYGFDMDEYNARVGALEKKESELLGLLEQTEDARLAEAEKEAQAMLAAADAGNKFRDSLKQIAEARANEQQARAIAEQIRIDPKAAAESIEVQLKASRIHETQLKDEIEKNEKVATDPWAKKEERDRARAEMDRLANAAAKAARQTDTLEKAQRNAQQAATQSLDRIKAMGGQGAEALRSIRQSGNAGPGLDSLSDEWKRVLALAMDRPGESTEKRVGDMLAYLKSAAQGNQTVADAEKRLADARKSEWQRDDDKAFQSLLTTNPAMAAQAAAAELARHQDLFSRRDDAAETALAKARQTLLPEDVAAAERATLLRGDARVDLDRMLRRQEMVDAREKSLGVDGANASGTFSARVASMMAQNGGANVAERQLATAEKTHDVAKDIEKNTRQAAAGFKA